MEVPDEAPALEVPVYFGMKVEATKDKKRARSYFRSRFDFHSTIDRLGQCRVLKSALPLEAVRGLEHFIGRLDGFGVDFVGTLGGDHVDHLLHDLDVGHF